MTTEDAGLQVDAENKVTVRGAEAFTLADLRVAARELTSRGVPAGARLEVTMNTTGTRWSVTARWEPAPGIVLPPEEPARGGLTIPEEGPDPAAADAPVVVYPCGRCGGEMVKDGARPSGYRHLNKLADKHPATLGRPVRDSPQA